VEQVQRVLRFLKGGEMEVKSRKATMQDLPTMIRMCRQGIRIDFSEWGDEEISRCIKGFIVDKEAELYLGADGNIKGVSLG